MDFTPLKDFYDEDLRSCYCVGLNYRVRPGDAVLIQKLPQWVEAGMVRPGTADAPIAAAAVKGAGQVADPAV